MYKGFLDLVNLNESVVIYSIAIVWYVTGKHFES